MGSISLTIHPLFFLFGFYYAFTGRIFVFIIYTVCAVLHELGHSFVASGNGYKLNKITLMPFGAVVSGDIDGLKLTDEIKIALAGPFMNLAIGLFFVAVWWIYPESYAFTDVVAEANFSMALINFLPVFPLDGGRVLSAWLSLKFGKKRSDIICKIVGLTFSVLLILAFVLSLFQNPNYSILLFSAFVIFGMFGKGKENKYVKIFTGVNEAGLLRGMPVKTIALSKKATVKKLISVMDVNAINKVEVYDLGKKITTLSQERVEEIIKRGEIYSPIEKYL